MSFGEGRHPVAKKRHVCIWCNSGISIGERHFYFFGEYEGDIQNWRMHSDCMDAHGRETSDGEICDSSHQRGRTCDEKEAAERKIARDATEVIVGLLREKKVSEDVLDLVIRQNIGSIILKDVFLESVYDEGRRVAEARQKAIEAGKKVKVAKEKAV